MVPAINALNLLTAFQLSPLLSLNLLDWQTELRVENREGKQYIFDPVRKKWLVLQPEELVRQLLVQELLQRLKVPPSRLRLEYGLEVNGLARRCDVLVFDAKAQPIFLAECKAPNIKLSQATFDQVARYNLPLCVPYLMISNGPSSWACAINHQAQSWHFLSQLPSYVEMSD